MANKTIFDLTEDLSPADADVVEIQKEGGGVGSSRRVPLSSLGGGDVAVSGTPLDNQIAVWTAADTIEGDVNLTFDTGTDTLATVNINASGALTCGDFTSTAIVATAPTSTEMTLTTNLMALGVDGVDYVIKYGALTRGLNLSGDVNLTGGTIKLRGNSYPAQARDIVFQASSTEVGRFDWSERLWNFGGEDMITTGKFSCNGLQDNTSISGLGLQLTDANLVCATAGSYTIKRDRGDKGIVISGGTGATSGANMTLTGTTEVPANEIKFRKAGTNLLLYVSATDTWSFVNSKVEMPELDVTTVTEQFKAAENLVNGDYCVLNSSAEMAKVDASAESTADGVFGVATGTIGIAATGTFQVGKRYTTTGLTAGAVYYASLTGGAITTTAPSSSGEVVRRIGQALSTTVLYINASMDYTVVP